VRELSARYGSVEALHSATLSVADGEFVAILGPNGAGKSTLMRAVMGLVANTGLVRFRGETLPRAAPEVCASRGLVLVPEGRGIFAPMTVAENLELGAYLLRDQAEFARRHERVFTLFPRLRERLDQVAGSLSGGEQQMLALGRGLMAAPELLLLDEPSQGLAPRIVEQIFETIDRIRRASNLTILLVEQRVVEALELCDRGYVLETGRVALEGTHAALLADPRVQRAYLGA
jgi:branched-chain amino acid transport system ATP-binding protein